MLLTLQLQVFLIFTESLAHTESLRSPNHASHIVVTIIVMSCLKQPRTSLGLKKSTLKNVRNVLSSPLQHSPKSSPNNVFAFTTLPIQEIEFSLSQNPPRVADAPLPIQTVTLQIPVEIFNDPEIKSKPRLSSTPIQRPLPSNSPSRLSTLHL